MLLLSSLVVLFLWIVVRNMETMVAFSVSPHIPVPTPRAVGSNGSSGSADVR